MDWSGNGSQTGNTLWVFPPENPQLVDVISKEFMLPPAMAQILVSRGITSLDRIHNHLYAKLPDLFDPFQLEEMNQAVDRVCTALEKDEAILIYGDNDVDGMTGTALLTDFFQWIGAKAFSYVLDPEVSRQMLIIEALEYALQKECKLLITVDCGITAAAEIEQVVQHHIDVIITDHHEPTHKIPHCVATLNPKLFRSAYPNRDLTGVGVAFKLAHAVTQRLVVSGKIPAKKVDLKRYLDLVALGTISDMGSLTGENRILVRYGLKQLRKTKRIGLAKLVTVCGLEPHEVSTTTIASKIAPRLNSLGRIADPQKGVQLLLVRNVVEAERLALELDLNNIERQRIERTVSSNVEEMLRSQPSLLQDKAIVMSSEAWHSGVIAILTTRIAKQYNRPTVIIAIENGVGKGSIRSIPQFPVLAILKENASLLLNFGGHDVAAGLTLKKENIAAFKAAFIREANSRLTDQDITPKLYLDANVQFEDLSFEFMESLRLLEPYGNGNTPPLLYTEAKQAWPPKAVGKSHLKLFLEQGDRLLEGIAFGLADRQQELRKRDLTLQVAFVPQINTFQNKSSIQLVVRDFRIVEPGRHESASKP